MPPFSSCIVTLVFGLKLEFDKSIDNPPDPINGNEKVRNDLPTMIKFVMMRVIGAENHAILRNQKQIKSVPVEPRCKILRSVYSLVNPL